MQRGRQGMCTGVWVQEEARGTRFPAWSYRQLWAKWHAGRELNLGLEQEQYGFLKLNSTFRLREAFFSNSLIQLIIFKQAIEKILKYLITSVVIHFWLKFLKGRGGLAPCILSGLTGLPGWLEASSHRSGWNPIFLCMSLRLLCS